MNRFRTVLCVYSVTATLLGVLIAVRAAGQEASPSGRTPAQDEPPAASRRSDGSLDALREDAGGMDQAAAAKDPAQKAGSKAKGNTKAEPEFVRKTDAEWRKILTRTQYMVTRQKATEPAFSGKYATGHFRGMFQCVCCDADVFSALNKFDSGTGWPSFDRPANAKAVGRVMDYSSLEPKVEVMCRRCGAHLGHIFDDGPTITGLRYCLNSVAIKLKPPEGESGLDQGCGSDCIKGQVKIPREFQHQVESQVQVRESVDRLARSIARCRK